MGAATVYGWLTEQGVSEEEQRRVFNVGIGMCAVVPRGRGSRARDRTRDVIGVLVSGEGTNLQALIDAGLPVSAVASNKPGARALERAAAAGIPGAVFELDDYESREQRDAAMADWLVGHGVTLVVCAGYMHLLRPAFLERFEGGREHALGAAARVPGRAPDRGRARGGRRPRQRPPSTTSTRASTPAVIVAEPVPVRDGDTVETLRARVQEVEHRLLPEAVKELIS